MKREKEDGRRERVNDGKKGEERRGRGTGDKRKREEGRGQIKVGRKEGGREERE